AVQAGFVAGTLITAVTNLADAINARRLFAAGCVFGAACNGAIVIAPSAAAIIALRFCTGAALAWVYPPGMKIVAGWFSDRRGMALGVVVGAVRLVAERDGTRRIRCGVRRDSQWVGRMRAGGPLGRPVGEGASGRRGDARERGLRSPVAALLWRIARSAARARDRLGFYCRGRL